MLRSFFIIVAIIFIGGSYLQHRGKVKREETEKRLAAEKREQFLRDSVQLEVLRRDSIRRVEQQSYYQQQREQYQQQNQAYRDSMRERMRCAPVKRVYETDDKGNRTLKEEIRQPGC